MLIKFEEEKHNFYLCSSSDWTTIVLAESPLEAASEAICKIVEASGLDFNIAPAIRVKKIKEKLENSDRLFRMDEILSDVGMYKESRALKEILENDRD